MKGVSKAEKDRVIQKYHSLPKTVPIYADGGIYSYLLIHHDRINYLKQHAFDGFDMYHMGEAGKLNEQKDAVIEGGLIVSDVTIDAGLGEDGATIMQLSDLHFAYLNEQDLKEANPTLLSTYERRRSNPDHMRRCRRALEYAAIADQVVVTGDGIDYLSHGNVEALYTEVWDRYPDALITGGNHEYEQQMLGTVPDIYTMEEKMAWVKRVWKHDYEYATDRVGKVLLIALDNGRRCADDKYYGFATGSAEKLEADLKTAKENGYAVLLFMHVPLYTRNPKETDVLCHFVNDLTNRFDTPNRRTIDFCHNPVRDFCGHDGMDPSGETAKTFRVITNYADVIKGIFNGHTHGAYYTEIVAKTTTGEDAVIPQYTMNPSGCYNGHVVKITVK